MPRLPTKKSSLIVAVLNVVDAADEVVIDAPIREIAQRDTPLTTAKASQIQ